MRDPKCQPYSFPLMHLNKWSRIHDFHCCIWNYTHDFDCDFVHVESTCLDIDVFDKLCVMCPVRSRILIVKFSSVTFVFARLLPVPTFFNLRSFFQQLPTKASHCKNIYKYRILLQSWKTHKSRKEATFLQLCFSRYTFVNIRCGRVSWGFQESSTPWFFLYEETIIASATSSHFLVVPSTQIEILVIGTP